MSTRHDSVPDLNAVAKDALWCWRLAAGLQSFLFKGDPEVLKAPAPHEQAAATVMYASGLLEDGRAQDAHEALLALLTKDELDVIDHGWVQLSL